MCPNPEDQDKINWLKLQFFPARIGSCPPSPLQTGSGVQSAFYQISAAKLNTHLHLV